MQTSLGDRLRYPERRMLCFEGTTRYPPYCCCAVHDGWCMWYNAMVAVAAMDCWNGSYRLLRHRAIF